MDTFMNTINTGITASSVWDSIAPTAGLIVTITLIALGAYVLRKNLKRAGKAKSGTV